ncbi:hypothetical protein ACFLQR_02760 [Verrucomicrobiota bacterium]
MKPIGMTLAVLLSLTAQFHEGLEHLKNKEYDKAIAKLTQVISAEPNVTDLSELSMLYRGQAFLESGKKEQALNDWGLLLKTSENEDLKKRALSLYKEAEGDMKKLLPEKSPRQVLNKFIGALQDGNTKVARACLGDGLLQLLDTVNSVYMKEKGESFLMEFATEVKRLNFVSEHIDETNQTALLTAEFHGQYTFELVQKEGKWVFASVKDYVRQRHHNVAHRVPTQTDDTNKLRQLSAAIEQYAMEYAAMPGKLSDVTEYLRDFSTTRISSADGKPFVFAISKKGGQPWVFTSTATGGRRQGIFAGQIQTLSEEAFKALAKTHGIKLPQQWTEIKVNAAKRKEIQALIDQLGAKTHKERREAYDELKSLGPNAGEMLEKATNNPDPEIAVQAKELLSEL